MKEEMGLNSKWFVTVASIWIQCSSGASYVFGIYSPVLKSSQNYNQSTLDYIAVFKDIGANAGLLAGLLYSAVVTASPASHPSNSNKKPSGIIRRISGPWIVITTGAFLCFTGYFSMWLAVTGRIHRPPVPLMCFFMFLASHSLTFLNTANVVTAVHNFPDYSGTIVGIIKGFVGISGAVLIQVYQTIFVDKPTSFILMLALLPTSVSLLLMFFVRIHNPTRGNTDEKKHLNRFSLIACLIAAYLMILIILENTVKFGLAARIVTFLILMFGLSSMMGVAIRADLTSDIHKFPPNTSSSLELATTNSTHQDKLEVGKMDAKQNLPVLNQGVDQEFPFDQDKRRIDQPLQPNLNLLQAMKTLEFWLLFAAMACGLGSGMATVNNISQIGGSFGYTEIETRTLVSLWSIWNFVGRFGAGFISDYFLHRRGWARPIFMAITLATMGIGHVVIASGLPGALYAGSTLVGVCYGSQWSLMPTITSEVFGVAHLGTIFNTIAFASPIGSYILSVRVVGFIYDKEASSDHSGNTCFGHHCFMISFVIMAIVSTLGFLISLGLYFMTRRFYREVIFGRLPHSSTKQQGER